MLVERLRRSARRTLFPGARDDVVEGGVGFDELVGTIAGGDHPVELRSQVADHARVGVNGGHRRRLGLKHPPHLEQLENRPSAEQVRGRQRRLEQLARLEARHVRTVALPHLEDAGQRERPNGFAQRVARQPELVGEVVLAGEARPRAPFARGDELPDPLDRVVRDAATIHPMSLHRHRVKGDYTGEVGGSHADLLDKHPIFRLKTSPHVDADRESGHV